MEADAYGTSEDWGVAKPDPAFFRRCCAELGSLPAETAYVGDDPVRDVATARAAELCGSVGGPGPSWVIGTPPKRRRPSSRASSSCRVP